MNASKKWRIDRSYEKVYRLGNGDYHFFATFAALGVGRLQRDDTIIKAAEKSATEKMYRYQERHTVIMAE